MKKTTIALLAILLVVAMSLFTNAYAATENIYGHFDPVFSKAMIKALYGEEAIAARVLKADDVKKITEIRWTSKQLELKVEGTISGEGDLTATLNESDLETLAKIEKVSGAFADDFIKLKTLVIRDTEIEELPTMPKTIKELESARNYDLGKVTSANLPEGIETVTIKDSNDSLTNLPDLPPSITSLDLRNNKGLTAIPSLARLTDIVYFDMSGCKAVTKLPVLPELSRDAKKAVKTFNIANTGIELILEEDLPDYIVDHVKAWDSNDSKADAKSTIINMTDPAKGTITTSLYRVSYNSTEVDKDGEVIKKYAWEAEKVKNALYTSSYEFYPKTKTNESVLATLTLNSSKGLVTKTQTYSENGIYNMAYTDTDGIEKTTEVKVDNINKTPLEVVAVSTSSNADADGKTTLVSLTVRAVNGIDPETGKEATKEVAAVTDNLANKLEITSDLSNLNVTAFKVSNGTDTEYTGATSSIKVTFDIAKNETYTAEFKDAYGNTRSIVLSAGMSTNPADYNKTTTTKPTEPEGFKDIPEKWYQKAIEYVSTNKIMTGYNATTFAPEDKVTREMFAAIIWKLAGKPEASVKPNFSDVTYKESEADYYNAVAWASEKGIVNGYENSTKFGYKDYVTRQDAILMLQRYVANVEKKETPATGSLAKFTDAAGVRSNTLDAMKWAVGAGVINGDDNNPTLRPNETASRAEMATIMMNFCER